MVRIFVVCNFSYLVTVDSTPNKKHVRMCMYVLHFPDNQPLTGKHSGSAQKSQWRPDR